MLKLVLLFTLIIGTLSQLITKNDVQIDCQKIPSTFWCTNNELTEACNFTQSCENRQNSTSKVQLTVLFSSFCYHSQKFINEVLFPNIYTNFKDHVEIDLVPFGNANRTEDGSIYCKAGEEECQAHLFITCAKQYIEDPIPLIYCMESKFRRDRNVNSTLEKCYEKWKIDERVQEKIEECANGKEGQKLQQLDADRTENTFPDWADNVPWILFNNLSLSALQTSKTDLQYALCNFYLTNNKPEVCNTL